MCRQLQFSLAVLQEANEASTNMACKAATEAFPGEKYHTRPVTQALAPFFL